MKNGMLIKKQKPFPEMTTDELVSYIKNETEDAQTGYILFAKYRSGLPELDAKEFNNKFKEATSDVFDTYDEILFEPTHVSKESGLRVQIDRIKNGVVYFFTAYGGFGSEPEKRFYEVYNQITYGSGWND